MTESTRTSRQLAAQIAEEEKKLLATTGEFTTVEDIAVELEKANASL